MELSRKSAAKQPVVATVTPPAPTTVTNEVRPDVVVAMPTRRDSLVAATRALDALATAAAARPPPDDDAGMLEEYNALSLPSSLMGSGSLSILAYSPAAAASDTLSTMSSLVYQSSIVSSEGNIVDDAAVESSEGNIVDATVESCEGNIVYDAAVESCEGNIVYDAAVESSEGNIVYDAAVESSEGNIVYDATVLSSASHSFGHNWRTNSWLNKDSSRSPYPMI